MGLQKASGHQLRGHRTYAPEGRLDMWTWVFYVAAALAYAGIRDLVFYLMDSPCEGLCDILASGFIFMVVVFGPFNWIHRKLFSGKHIFS